MVLQNWSNTLKTDLGKLSIDFPHSKRSSLKLKEGERRTVSVLFADIKGFTSMSERLDPEDVQLIIDGCFKILTGEIEKLGGYIDKYEGDRIMALFGSLKASEHDTQNALRAAIAMRGKFAEINRILKEQGIEIGIRIGVNTGLVVTGKIGKERAQDFTVMGDTVNLASRLETNAPLNGILIEESTKKIAGEEFTYESLGKISVKGKSDPIAVYRVKDLNHKRVRRWSSESFAGCNDLIGRGPELEAIRAMYAQACEDTSKSVLGIKGGAGMGKSRLVCEAIEGLSKEKGSTVPFMNGYCRAAPDQPYSLFVSAVESFFMGKSERKITRALIDSKVDKLLENLSKEEVKCLKESMPFFYYMMGIEEDPDISHLEPKALSTQIRLAIKRIIDSMAKHLWKHKGLPMILSLEDLQWSDSSSLSFLDYYAGNMNVKVPVLIVLQYRPEFSAAKELPNIKDLHETVLAPLSREDMLGMIEGVIGRSTLESRFGEMVMSKAGGNPFYMEEMLRSLIETGLLKRRDHRYELTEEALRVTLPDSVSRILLARIDLLHDLEKKILQVCSVIGKESDIKVIKGVLSRSGIEIKDLDDHLANLIEGGFIKIAVNKKLSFRNAALSEIVYDTLLNSNKKLLHGSVANSIVEGLNGREELEEHSFKLAGHYIESRSVEQACRFSLIALKKALRDYNNQDALSLSKKFLELLDMQGQSLSPAGENCLYEALEIKARVLDVLGMRQDQDTVIRRLVGIARKLQDKFKWLRVLAMRGKYYIDISDYEKALKDAGQIKDALECNEKGSLFAEALRISGLAYFNTGQYEKALESFMERSRISLTISERDPFLGSSASVQANSDNAIGLIYQRMGRFRESLRFYSRSLKTVKETKDKLGTAICLGNMGLVHYNLGEIELAFECYRTSLVTFNETGYKKGIAANTGNIGAIYNRIGRYEEALKHLGEAMTIREEIDDAKGMCIDMINQAISYRCLGNVKRSLELLSKSVDIAKRQQNSYMLGMAMNEQAATLIATARPKEIARALELTERTCSLGKDSKIPLVEIMSVMNRAKALFELGRKQEALKESNIALKHLSKREGTERSMQEVLFNHYVIAKGQGMVDEAGQHLDKARNIVLGIADKIKDASIRESFLNKVEINRKIIREYERENG